MGLAAVTCGWPHIPEVGPIVRPFGLYGTNPRYMGTNHVFIDIQVIVPYKQNSLNMGWPRIPGVESLDTAEWTLRIFPMKY